MSGSSVFFHVDLDAFFASVEQLDNPAYCGQPVIVGGMGRRGVVSTCSYEARKFGVHSAMPMMRARSLCPHGIFIQTRMQRYYEKSKEVMNIFRSFTPEVQQLSIDEAFLNMSGMETLFGAPEDAARLLKKMIFEKTGLRVSVGSASNKYIAKIASGKSKPDGLLIVPCGKEALFMSSLSLQEIWGIGGKTRAKLAEVGLTSIPALLAQRETRLQRLLGDACGSFLYQALRGDTARIFNEERKNKTMSVERTFEYDLYEKAHIADAVFLLSAELMCRIFDTQVKSRTVHIKIRYADFTTVSAQHSGQLINDSTDLYERALRLCLSRLRPGAPVRLIGIGVNADKDAHQPELFICEHDAKKRKAEEAVLQISKKNRGLKIMQARLLPPSEV